MATIPNKIILFNLKKKKNGRNYFITYMKYMYKNQLKILIKTSRGYDNIVQSVFW